INYLHIHHPIPTRRSSDLLKVPVITPIFKDFKNGDLKIISFFAKKARGAMVRYIIDKDVKTLEDLKGFDYEGYAYAANESANDKDRKSTRLNSSHVKISYA